jgi:hypothetical protein
MSLRKLRTLVVGDVLHLFVQRRFVADVVDHGAQAEHGVGREILVADVSGDVIVGIAYGSVGADVFGEGFGGLLETAMKSCESL